MSFYVDITDSLLTISTVVSELSLIYHKDTSFVIIY